MNSKQKGWLLVGPVIFSLLLQKGGLSTLTNREKAIAALTEWLKPLNNSQLADIILRTYDGDFICHHCIHNVDYEWTRRNWTCRAKGTCEDGVKQWLEQE